MAVNFGADAEVFPDLGAPRLLDLPDHWSSQTLGTDWCWMALNLKRVKLGKSRLEAMQDTPPTNILDQIVGYDSMELEADIGLLQRELGQQRQLNEQLTRGNTVQQIETVETFVRRNAAHVDDQLGRLRAIVSDLRAIVDANHTIERQETRFQELLASSEALAVANNLREIKRLREEVRFFLLAEGIAFPAR